MERIIYKHTLICNIKKLRSIRVYLVNVIFFYKPRLKIPDMLHISVKNAPVIIHVLIILARRKKAIKIFIGGIRFLHLDNFRKKCQ